MPWSSWASRPWRRPVPATPGPSAASDNGVTLEEALEHLRAIAAAVGLPVNADFEGGFAVDPEQVGANVRRAVSTGIAGLSIEDSTGDEADPLHDFDLAVERVRAARAGDRRERHRGGADRPLRGLRRRASRHRRDGPAVARLRGGGCRLPLRAADRHRRAGLGGPRRRSAQAGEPADQRPVHHGRGGGGSRGPADQRRGNPRADRLGGVPRDGPGDRGSRDVLPVRAAAGRGLAAGLPGSPVKPAAGTPKGPCRCGRTPPGRSGVSVVQVVRSRGRSPPAGPSGPG